MVWTKLDKATWMCFSTAWIRTADAIAGITLIMFENMTESGQGDLCISMFVI